MQDKYKYAIIGGLCAFCFIIGRNTANEKIITKTEEKIVYKEIEAKIEKRNIKTTKKPDGTIEVLDTTSLESLLSSQMDSIKTKEITKESRSSIIIGAYLTKNFDYAGSLSYRIAGPVFFNAYSKVNLSDFGAGLGIEL